MGVRCYQCGNPVPADGIGLNRKLVNRGIQRFLCLECLAKHFHITVHDLEVMADHFRDAGCMLFAPKEK